MTNNSNGYNNEGSQNNAQFQGQQNGQQFQQPQEQNYAQQQNYQQQTYQQQSYQQQNYQPYNQGMGFVDTGHSPVQIMVFGIISVVSGAVLSWTFVLGILAIVFGALAMSWSKKFNTANPYANNGQVKAGRVCGIIGLIFGILGLVGTLITAMTVGCAAIFGALDY